MKRVFYDWRDCIASNPNPNARPVFEADVDPKSLPYSFPRREETPVNLQECSEPFVCTQGK